MAGGCATRAKRPASRHENILRRHNNLKLMLSHGGWFHRLGKAALCRFENILLFLENVHPFKTPKDGAQVLYCVAACRARYNPNEKCSIIGIAGL